MYAKFVTFCLGQLNILPWCKTDSWSIFLKRVYNTITKSTLGILESWQTKVHNSGEGDFVQVFLKRKLTQKYGITEGFDSPCAWLVR